MFSKPKLLQIISKTNLITGKQNETWKYTKKMKFPKKSYETHQKRWKVT